MLGTPFRFQNDFKSLAQKDGRSLRNIEFADALRYAILLHPSLFIVYLSFIFISRFGSPLPEGAFTANRLPHIRTVTKNQEYRDFADKTNNSFVGEPLAAPAIQNDSGKLRIPKFYRCKRQIKQSLPPRA